MSGFIYRVLSIEQFREDRSFFVEAATSANTQNIHNAVSKHSRRLILYFVDNFISSHNGSKWTNKRKQLNYNLTKKTSIS